MSKKCPPGVLCIENYTIFVIFCILFAILGLFFLRKPSDENQERNVDLTIVNSEALGRGPFVSEALGRGPYVRAEPGISYSDQFGDILLNPYAPPVNDERYIIPSRDVRTMAMGMGMPRGMMPINIRTQGFDSPYRQVGILTSTNGQEQILALMGRPVLSNRDQWQYYTMSEKNNIKLPVSVKGKSCMNEYGCDKIYDGDTVYIQGYNNVFRATIYDNDTLRYIPVV